MEKFASYLGLVPGEDSSSDSQKRLGITKAGNTHVRRLLVEAAQCYGRGQVGHKFRLQGFQPADMCRGPVAFSFITQVMP